MIYYDTTKMGTAKQRSGLTRVSARLREEFAVYMMESTRINLAGITPANIDDLAAAVHAVLEPAA